MARNILSHNLAWLYRRLLRLYPPRFREKFGAEMLEVFQQAAAEQAQAGSLSLIKFALGELAGLLLAAFSVRRRMGDTMMDQNPVKPLPAPVFTLPTGEIILGMLPLFFLGVAAIIESMPVMVRMPQGWALGVFISGYLAAAAGLLWGWRRDFPRWSYPYPVHVVIFALYFFLGVNSGVRLGGLDLLSWFAFVPLGVVIYLALRAGKSPVDAVEQMLAAVWKDWTLLVFALYGLLPLIIPIVLDETDRAYRFPATAAAVAVMLVCAFLYVTAAKPWLRTMLVLGGLFLSMVVASAGSEFYWKTHTIDIVTNERQLIAGPAPWGDILTQATFGTAAFTLGLLALPILIGFLHWLSSARRSGSSGAGA